MVMVCNTKRNKSYISGTYLIFNFFIAFIHAENVTFLFLTKGYWFMYLFLQAWE